MAGDLIRGNVVPGEAQSLHSTFDSVCNVSGGDVPATRAWIGKVCCQHDGRVSRVLEDVCYTPDQSMDRANQVVGNMVMDGVVPAAILLVGNMKGG